MSGERNIILDAFKSALENISTANGYNTAAGSHVSRDLKAYENTPMKPALFVTSEVESLTREDQRISEATWGITVVGYIDRKIEPSEEIENLIDDIKKAIFTDETLGGNVRWIDLTKIDQGVFENIGICEVGFTVYYEFEKP